MSTVRSLGKYRLVAELGHGGMADVFLAMVAGPAGSGFTKLAVVKKLRAHLSEDLDFVAMLVDEARISARLNHPNVVQTLEVGVENGEYFLAMEFLDGQPLHRIQRRAKRGGAPLADELEYVIVADMLAGLQHAHELADYDGTPLGIVHRDVTPQNIFITYAGQVKVVDFGIAKAAGRASETKHGIVKGKVRYMSPEQAMGYAVDCRADIFSAGLLLWEAATKEHFWRDLDDLAIVQALLGGQYDASPRSIAPDVPMEIDAICRRAMAHDARDRYASAAEFRADLERFIGDGIVTARRRLGPFVAELFAKERGRLRDVIEQTSRANVEPMSLATLAASHSRLAMESLSSSSGVSTGSSQHANGPSASLSPVAMTDSRQAPQAERLRPGPTRLRSLFVPSLLALVVVASAVLASVSANRIAGGLTQAADASKTERERSALDVRRTPLVLRSTPARRIEALRRGTTIETAPSTAASTRGHAVPTRAEAPAVAVATEEVSPPPSPAPAPPPSGAKGPDGSKRKPVIDLADPWMTAN